MEPGQNLLGDFEISPFEIESDHSWEILHLWVDDLFLRMGVQTWIDNFVDGFVLLQELSDGHAINRMLFLPETKRFDSSENESTLEIRGDSPVECLYAFQLFVNCWIVGRNAAHNNITMSSHVLGGTVQTNVGPEQKRRLVDRRAESGVHHRQYLVFFSQQT